MQAFNQKHFASIRQGVTFTLAMLTIHEQTVWHVILIIVIIKYDTLSINMSEIIYEFHHF